MTRYIGNYTQTSTDNRASIYRYDLLQRDEPVYLTDTKRVKKQWHLFCIVHNIGKCVKPIAKEHGKES